MSEQSAKAPGGEPGPQSPRRVPTELEMVEVVVVVERFFLIKERETNFYREIKGGLIHFVCTAFILAVNPRLIAGVGDAEKGRKVAVGTALAVGFASILCGCTCNLPFVLAPTTSTSLYFGLILETTAMARGHGNVAVLLLGLVLIACSMFSSVVGVLTKVVPFQVKVGAILGIALLVSLEALCQLNVVQRGDRTILAAGEFTGDVYIAFFSLVVIGVCLHYQVRGAFFVGMITAALLYVTSDSHKTWPPARIIARSADFPGGFNIARSGFSDRLVWKLFFDLLVISIILVDGLSSGLAVTAGMTTAAVTAVADASGPGSGSGSSSGLWQQQSRWLYFAIGCGSVMSACLGAGPVLVSPESAPGIKAGSKTGLSAVICGLLYFATIPFTPLLATLPATCTSPVLMIVALMLFENSGKIRWDNIQESIVVFTQLVLIPFTYSVFNGVNVGICMYIIMELAVQPASFLKKTRLIAGSIKALAQSSAGAGSAETEADIEYHRLSADGAKGRELLLGSSPGENQGERDGGSDDDDDRDESLSFQLSEVAAPNSQAAEVGGGGLVSFDDFRRQQRKSRTAQRRA